MVNRDIQIFTLEAASPAEFVAFHFTLACVCLTGASCLDARFERRRAPGASRQKVAACSIRVDLWIMEAWTDPSDWCRYVGVKRVVCSLDDTRCIERRTSVFCLGSSSQHQMLRQSFVLKYFLWKSDHACTLRALQFKMTSARVYKHRCTEGDSRRSLCALASWWIRSCRVVIDKPCLHVTPLP